MRWVIAGWATVALLLILVRRVLAIKIEVKQGEFGWGLAVIVSALIYIPLIIVVAWAWVR